MIRPLATSCAVLVVALALPASAQQPPPSEAPPPSPEASPTPAPHGGQAPQPATTAKPEPPVTAPAPVVPTPAPVTLPAVPPRPLTARPESRGWGIEASLGARIAVLPSAGFDPFASNDVLSSFSLSAGMTVARLGNLSFAVVPEWDIGSVDANARAAKTSLTMDRFGLGLSARYHLGSPFFLYAKVTPGAYHVGATITEVQRVLEASAWSWSVDTTVGAGLLFIRTDIADHPIRIGITWDMGASFAGNVAMNFKQQQVDGIPQHPGTLTLPELHPMGFVNNLAATVTF